MYKELTIIICNHAIENKIKSHLISIELLFKVDMPLYISLAAKFTRVKWGNGSLSSLKHSTEKPIDGDKKRAKEMVAHTIFLYDEEKKFAALLLLYQPMWWSNACTHKNFVRPKFKTLVLRFFSFFKHCFPLLYVCKYAIYSLINIILYYMRSFVAGYIFSCIFFSAILSNKKEIQVNDKYMYHIKQVHEKREI